MSTLLTIGRFADMVGIPSHTLRRLSASGKFMPSIVTEGGHRMYNESRAEEASQFVHKMKLLPAGRNVIDESEEDLDSFFAYLLGLILADGTALASGQVQLEMKDFQIMNDVANILGVICHPRKDRPTYRLTVPRNVSNRLVEYGVCRRKSKGFDVPTMNSNSFGHFLRGLFDGDGSISHRDGRITVRIHGHPRPMGDIQSTLMIAYGIYLPWVLDNRTESGMLETSRKLVVDILRENMYSHGGISLRRKQF